MRIGTDFTKCWAIGRAPAATPPQILPGLTFCPIVVTIHIDARRPEHRAQLLAVRKMLETVLGN